MLGSIFIGLSGMDAYSNGLRQVSNNITNLNTTGFRASSVVFNDLFSNGESGVSYLRDAPPGGGVELSDFRLDFSQGELRQTDRDLDLAVQGTGFLVLEKDGEYAYTRTGNFEIDSDGFVVLSGTDYKLTLLDEGGVPQTLSIDNFRTNSPKQTSRITFADNLSSTADEHRISGLAVFNADGESNDWEVVFSRAEDAELGEWTVTVTNQDSEEIGVQTIKFVNGELEEESYELTFENEETGRSVIFDFSENVTSFSSGSISTLRSSDIDGYGIGEIAGLQVNDTGVLEITYTNEQSEELGAVSLANFRDPQGLEQRNGGLFVYDLLEGRDFYSSESDQVGRVLSRRVEASNVDLSQQFGDLILVQRGYQASSQVVSVSNDMIQQLFGIRGQG